MARVLMVDDDEMERVYAAEVLRWGRHDPVFAHDGEAALKILEQGDVDVVITDLAMPGMDGLSLIRAVRAVNDTIPILAISGVSQDQLAEAERLGADRSFPKPWDARAVVDAVDALHAAAQAAALDEQEEYLSDEDFLD